MPWLLASILSHLQIFAMLVNFTSLVCGLLVAVLCSLLMWTTQIEEALVHETNFRESITMLVVQDNESSEEVSANEEVDEMNGRVTQVKKERHPDNQDRDGLLKQQQHHANIVAARTFLKMSEQRDSVGSVGAVSGRSSYGPSMNDEYANIYRSEKASVIGKDKQNKGLTEQVIKKNTLDKSKSRPAFLHLPDASATE